MSHITKIKTKITDLRYLCKALDDLNFTYEIGDLEIQGFNGKKTKVEIKVKIPYSNDIGLRKIGDYYEVVADWFGVIGIKREQFLNSVQQKYAYRVTRDKLEEQGFQLIEEKSEENSQIRLILRRMA